MDDWINSIMQNYLGCEDTFYSRCIYFEILGRTISHFDGDPVRLGNAGKA